jgi:hypothetical protein
VRDIFESFDFHTQIDRLAKGRLLYLVAEKFAHIDLHPDAVSNAQMADPSGPPPAVETIWPDFARRFFAA